MDKSNMEESISLKNAQSNIATKNNVEFNKIGK